MELREVWAALRAGWWLAVVGLLVGGAVALAVSLLQTPKYTASTQLFVSTTASATPSDVFQGSQFSQQRVASYAQLITGEALARRVVDRLGLPLIPKQLSQEVTATAVPNTVLIDVTVTDPSPQRAQAIAGAVGTEFATMATQLEAGADGVSPVKVTVAQAPDLPSTPSSPKTVRNVALGLLVGLLVGAGVAVARVRLDRSVKDGDEAAELAGVPVIGTILRDEALGKEHVVEKSRGSRVTENFRQLRNNLQFLSVDRPPKVIMVSSAVPAEGKTTLAINLALALAEAGKLVTIVEADLRQPKVTDYLGMVGGVGLTNVLAGNADVAEVVQSYGPIAILAAGPNPPNPGELLASSQMAGLLDKLRADNDFVLVDAPPLLPVADSSGLAVHVDGVLLSIRYGSTSKEQLRQAATTLHRVGAARLGVVLNIVPPKAELAADRGYGYGYGYDAPKHAAG